MFLVMSEVSLSPLLLAMGTETDRQIVRAVSPTWRFSPLNANSTALLYMINAHSSHNCSYPAAISAQLNTAEYSSSSSYPVIEAGSSSHPGAQPIPNQPWCVYRPLFDPLVCRSDQATLIQKDDRYCLAIIPASIHAFTVNVQWGRRDGAAADSAQVKFMLISCVIICGAPMPEWGASRATPSFLPQKQRFIGVPPSANIC